MRLPVQPTRLTEIEFLYLLRRQRRAILHPGAVVERCACGDVNCLGWRLVSEGTRDE